MHLLLLQNQASSAIISLETSGGSVAEGLDSTDVQVDLRKEGEAFFSNKVLVATVDATADIGSGANGVVTLAVPGLAGNAYTVEVTVPAGTHPLTIIKSGAIITVELAVIGGVPDGVQNTATLVATAINTLDSEVSAVASGTGVTALTIAEGPTPFANGIDGDFTDLGAGSYELDLSTSDTDTLGQFFIRFKGPNIRTVIITAMVVTAVAATPTPDLAIPTTTLFGYILDVAGIGVPGASVGVRTLSVPTVLHPTLEGLVITNDLLTVVTDDTGFFTIDLVTGSQIDLFIPVAGYRRTFTVPTASTNVFDIP